MTTIIICKKIMIFSIENNGNVANTSPNAIAKSGAAKHLNDVLPVNAVLAYNASAVRGLA
ncbi:hypothetical protein ACWWD9_07125 [Methylovorus sp. SPW-M1]